MVLIQLLASAGRIGNRHATGPHPPTPTPLLFLIQVRVIGCYHIDDEDKEATLMGDADEFLKRHPPCVEVSAHAPVFHDCPPPSPHTFCIPLLAVYGPAVNLARPLSQVACA